LGDKINELASILMKSIYTIILSLVYTYSFSQDWTGKYYVDKMDTPLLGTYFTFEFENDHRFKVYSKECKSVEEGKGVYKVSQDSIFFFFSHEDTSRTEVNRVKLPYDSSVKVKLTFELFTKVRPDSIDWFYVKIKGKGFDTTFTSLDFMSELEIPKSDDTLVATFSIPALYDEVIFNIVPNESSQFKVWTTYGLDGFITNQHWAYRIERKKKNSFTLSTDGKKMKFKKLMPTKPNPH